MTSALERAIDSLSSHEITVTAALRQLLVVGHRIEAEALTSWIRSELDGYKPDDPVPEYRDGSLLSLAVRVAFDGPWRRREVVTVSAAELPESLKSVLEEISLRMPVAELEALADPEEEGEPGAPLPGWWVARYREAMERGEAPGPASYIANQAVVDLPRTRLVGILERVRTTALSLALELEAVSRDAGSSDGPTVTSDTELSRAVATHMTTIYAAPHSSVSVASGAFASAVQLAAGDVEGLLREAGKLIQDDGLAALRAALTDDGNSPAEATGGFLRRLRAGSYVVASGVTTSAAYDGLLALLGQVFPGYSG